MIKWSDKEAAIRALEKDGMVDPLDLIEAARSPEHPCHDDFTWDIEKAAEERWRDQARKLIRQVHFEILTDETVERCVMYVANETEAEEQLFVSVPKIRSKSEACSKFLREVNALLGHVNRVCGLVASKERLIGKERAEVIRDIRTKLNDLVADFE